MDLEGSSGEQQAAAAALMGMRLRGELVQTYFFVVHHFVDVISDTMWTTLLLGW
jgi:hypothetical protein